MYRRRYSRVVGRSAGSVESAGGDEGGKRGDVGLSQGNRVSSRRMKVDALLRRAGLLVNEDGVRGEDRREEVYWEGMWL